MRQADACPSSESVPSTLGRKQPALDAYDIVQLLERELAAERFERREEVSFLSKMHERELAVWKARAQGASQRLEEERRTLEREVGSLDSRLRSACEKAQQYEENSRRLEEKLAVRGVELEEAWVALRKQEASAESASAREVERKANQELALRRQGQVQQEHAACQLALQRAERDAQVSAEACRQEEIAARRGAEVLNQVLRTVEDTARTTKQQDVCLLEQTRVRADEEALVARARAAAQAAQMEEALWAAGRKATELELRVEAEQARTREVRAEEQRALQERSSELHAGLAQREVEHVAALKAARLDGQSKCEELRAGHRTLREGYASTEQELRRARSNHEQAECAWEDQLARVSRHLEDARNGRRELDAQCEQAMQHKAQTATLCRLELDRLRSELGEVRRWSGLEAEEVAQQRAREAELLEARNLASLEESRKLSVQVRQLERNLAEVELERVRVRAALDAAEQDRARSQAAVLAMRAELSTSQVRGRQVETEWASRASEELAQHRAEIGDEHWERLRSVECQWQHQLQLVEAERARAYTELKGSEASEAELGRALFELQSDMHHVSNWYRLQQERALQLDGAMRAHLDMIDREVADMRRAKGALSVAQADLGHLPGSGGGSGGSSGGDATAAALLLTSSMCAASAGSDTDFGTRWPGQ